MTCAPFDSVSMKTAVLAMAMLNVGKVLLMSVAMISTMGQVGRLRKVRVQCVVEKPAPKEKPLQEQGFPVLLGGGGVHTTAGAGGRIC